jgi:hypothetical protein
MHGIVPDVNWHSPGLDWSPLVFKDNQKSDLNQKDTLEIQFDPEHRLLIIFGESLPHFPILNENNDIIGLKASQ